MKRKTDSFEPVFFYCKVSIRAETFSGEVTFFPLMVSEAEAWISVQPVRSRMLAAFSGVTPPPGRRMQSSFSQFLYQHTLTCDFNFIAIDYYSHFCNR